MNARTVLLSLSILALGCLGPRPTILWAQTIPDTDLKTTSDLLRGFNDRELQEARRSIPRRPEPPLKAARPRLVNVSGRVFVDGNGNGKSDTGETGLGNVVVTDGERVIRTATDGGFRFQIRMDDNPTHRFVVVTRPNGYKPSRKFFTRIGFDESRTDYEASFGFQPDAAAAEGEFWFITASDSQFTSHEQMIPTAKDYAQVTSAHGKPAFLATAGDLTMNGSQFEWDMYDRIRGSSKIPVYEGFGGHDGNCLDPRCTVSFEQRIGPPFYSWNYGGVHFVQFVTETSYLRAPASDRQRDWMRADLGALPPKTPVIVISHYPLPASWFDQRKAEGINVVCQIGAHYHLVHAGSRRGVPVLNSAPARGRDWGAFSRTYRWVFVSPRGITSQLRVAGQYKRLKVTSPGPRTVQGSQPLVVLAYDTALLVKSVACRWTSPDGTQRTSMLKQQGDWSWHGSFAPETPGRWQCELDAVDVAGAHWKRIQTIRVLERGSPVASAGKDFPWILTGDPPRHLASGPSVPLYPRWVTNTGGVHVLHSSPALAGNRVYVAVGNPNAGVTGSVLCLDAHTGKEIWRAPSPLGDIRGSVSVHRNVVYAVTGEGWVVAYDAATGGELWRQTLKSADRQGRPLGIVNAPPVPTRFGLLVSDWQKPQKLLDYATGKQLVQLAGDVGAYSGFATVFGDVMYSVRRGGGNALKLPGGEVAWTLAETARSTSAPIVVDGKMIYATSGRIKAVDASSGKPIWETPHAHAGYQNSIPIVWGDLVLANGTDLHGLDLETGKRRWTVACGREADRFLRSRRQAMAGSSTPVVAGQLAFVGHDDTSIRAVDRQGHVQWEHRLGTPVKTAPIVSGNLLLVHDYAGNLWCFAGKASRESQ